MKAENVHFHVLELFSFPLTTEESGSTVLDETRLAFAETGDIRWDKVFGAHAFPWFAGSGCRERALTLNAPGEGLLLGTHGRGWRATGYRGHGEIEELMGRHAKMFAVGGAIWRETRLELHGGRVRDGGGVGRWREGIV